MIKSLNLFFLSMSGGGLDTSLQTLAKGLVKSGHRVSMIYPDSYEQLPEHIAGDQFKIYRVRQKQFHYYLFKMLLGLSSFPRTIKAFEFANAIGRLIKEISRKEKIDLIEIPEIFFTRDHACGIPYTVRLHSADWTWRVMLKEKMRLSDRVDIRLEAKTLSQAAGISSPNHFLKNYVMSKCLMNRNRSVELIPYPVDIEVFKPGAVESDSPMVLFVGRVEKRKGAHSLLEAIPLIHQKVPKCKFVFLGSISKDMGKKAVESIHAKFIGPLTHSELVEWYQKASVFVAPSLWDNSPNTIYEAMACGTPVVASRVGGIPELINDGITGLLVPPGDADALADAVVSLLGDKKRREQMGRCAREKVISDYSVEKIAAQTISFYEQILAKS